MSIRFTKALKIALGGINVVDYKVGDIVEHPHSDLKEFASHYEEILGVTPKYHTLEVTDDAFLEAQIKESIIIKTKEIQEREKEIQDLKNALATYEASKKPALPPQEVEPAKVEPVEVELPGENPDMEIPVVEDEGTKDERIVMKKKGKHR